MNPFVGGSYERFAATVAGGVESEIVHHVAERETVVGVAKRQ